MYNNVFILKIYFISIMNLKRSFFAVIACFLSLMAMAQSQEKFTLNLQKVTLESAMRQITEKCGYTFFYDVNQIDVNQQVSVNVKDADLRTVMREMLSSVPVDFEIRDKQIVLKRGEAKASQGVGAARQITGIVLDDTDQPVIGATVTIQGTVTGVLTDIDGRYTISAKQDQVLEFRYIGYKSVTKKIGLGNTINVTMETANINLDDVVIVGYGSQKKESVTSSVNSVKPAEISIPTRSLSNMIGGQVAGVISIQTSGEPGNDDASFWIRGQSSYAGGTSALVLVDGVPRSMNDLDVDEIESFTVLKDAAATAVYGSEGANGVVLITTKRGAAQKTKVSFNAQYSIAIPTRMPEVMHSWDYLSMWNEASWNDAGNPDWDTYMATDAPYSYETLELYRSGADPDLYPDAQWFDLMSNHTQNQRYTINFRGGGEKAKFFVSGAYYSEDGIFKSNPLGDYNANIGLKRYNVRSNVDFDITTTTKLSVDISGQYKTKNNPGYSSSDIFQHILRVPTHLIPMHWSDGTASAVDGEASGRYNPYNLLNYSGYSKSWTAALQTKATLRQELDFITKGLSIQGSLSFDANFTSSYSRSMTPAKYDVLGRNEDGTLIKQKLNEETALGNPTAGTPSGNKKVYIEAQLNYNRTFGGKHAVTGVLVYNQKETQYQGSWTSSGSASVSGSNLLAYRKQNVVARGTYTFDNRYVIEASFGATGSENFAAGHRWGIFPAVGAAWNVHAEKFMQKGNVLDIISKLRLRASYGLTGNDDTGQDRFIYREALTDSGDAYLGLTGAGGSLTSNYGQVYESTFAAPYLTWEIEKKANFGIDLGLFRGRVDITADYFTNRRENILIQRATIPTATGFRENPWQNFGVTTNKGMDASIVFKQNIGKDWIISARGNITYAVNKIVEKDEIEQAYPWMSQTGHSIGVNDVYIAEGLFTNNDFIITQNMDGSYNYKLKPGIASYTDEVRPGDIKYKDLNGDGQINQYDMTYDAGNYPNNPQIVYGFGLNVQWKGIDAGVFFQGVGRRSLNLNYQVDYFMPFTNGRDQSSARTEAISHWKATDPYNQNVTFPRLHTGSFANNELESTWYYRSGDYLRLKNVELGYTFDKKLVQKWKMQNLRVYVQGANVCLLYDKVKFWDPEVGNSGSRYPINATWTVGLDVTF